MENEAVEKKNLSWQYEPKKKDEQRIFTLATNV